MNNSSRNFLNKQLKGNYRYILVSMICIVVGSVFSLASPRFIGITVDSIIGTAPFDLPEGISNYLTENNIREYLYNNIYIIILLFLAISGINALFEFFRLLSVKNLTENLAFNIRQSVFEALQKAPFSYHRNIQTGDIIQRCSSDIETVRLFMVEAMDIIRIVFRLILSYIFMSTISVPLTIISFVIVPVVLGFSAIFYSKIQSRFLVADEAEGELQSQVQENLSAPRVVRAFGKQRYERDNFNIKNADFSNMWIKVGDLLAWYWAIGEFLTVVQTIVVLIASILLAANGGISTGDVISFMLYNAMLAWPIRTLGRIIGNMSKAMVALDRINEVYTAPKEDFESGKTFTFNGDIEFSGVDFSYDGQKLFTDLNFTIKKGQTVALLGAAGSGKSTILALLARFYTPEKGEITIDGININDINLSCLRKQLGIVMQEPFLFSRTIRENIAISDKNIDDEKVFKSAQIACVHESIEGFENKYETLVGERGVTLSGGQKQRVAIARTIYTGAKILCFDDSLSAVDSITDSNIRKQLKFHTEDITTFIISQRVNTLMQSDKILVLDKGSIKEEGTHDELVLLDGIYASIVKIQQEVIAKTKEEANK